MKQKSIFTAMLLALLSTGIIASAQAPAPPPGPDMGLRPSSDLDQMLGPIALYPDPLIAQILPAATVPSEIVMAARYVSGGGDPNLIDQQPWDDSIKALARYPTVLTWMDQNLAWATALGQSFLAQQQDVMDSIQRLRAQAQGLGNLQTSPQENVVSDDGDIEILPANPDQMYLPVYQPDQVYYQRPFGAPFISFGLGYSIGGWLNNDFDWHGHRMIAWGRDHPRPANWWSGRPADRRVEFGRAAVWQPRGRTGVVRGLDRGFVSHPVHAPVPEFRSPRPVERVETPVRRSEPVVVQRSAPAARAPVANGALIGVHSAQATRQASSRGQASRGPVASRPAAGGHSGKR
jgi:hypothetical protein